MSRPYDLETGEMNHPETGEMNRVRQISHPNSRMKVTLLISKCTRSDYPVNDAITYCWRGGRRRRPEMWVHSKHGEGPLLSYRCIGHQSEWTRLLYTSGVEVGYVRWHHLDKSCLAMEDPVPKADEELEGGAASTITGSSN
jgi:hypothetical protein